MCSGVIELITWTLFSTTAQLSNTSVQPVGCPVTVDTCLAELSVAEREKTEQFTWVWRSMRVTRYLAWSCPAKVSATCLGKAKQSPSLNIM